MRLACAFAAALCAIVVLPGPPQRAAAAAYCLTGNTMPPQCTYESAQQCARAAQNPGIGCVPNQAEVQHVYGGGRYCLATEQRIEYCIYGDFSSCNTAALHQGALCYDRHAIGPTDPYQYDTRRPPY